MARIICPECAARVTLPDSAPGGKRVRCDECGAAFDPGAAEPERPGRAAGWSSRSRKRRKKGGVGLKGAAVLIGGAVAAVLALALVVGGVVLIYGGRAGPGGGVPGIGGGLPGIGGGLLGVNPLVTRENARKVDQDMTIAQADAILGPGRACTHQEIAANIEADYGGLYVAAATPEGRGDESSWRLWQNGSQKIIAGFYRSKSGVERLCSVRFTNLWPGGAFECEEVFSSP